MSFLLEAHLSGNGSAGPSNTASSQLKPSSSPAKAGPSVLSRCFKDPPRTPDHRLTRHLDSALCSILLIPSNAKCQQLLLLQPSSSPGLSPSLQPPAPSPLPSAMVEAEAPALTAPPPSLLPPPTPTAASRTAIQCYKLAPAGPRVLWASATLGIKSPILSSPHKGFLVYPRLPL